VEAAPDTGYVVKLIELPRPGASCGAGETGVAAGQLNTDDAGNGATTVGDGVMSGATGIWVSIEGPQGDSRILSGDYRSSDYVVPM
jgi:hypothetical protein